jgi:pyruvate,water dikinase
LHYVLPFRQIDLNDIAAVGGKNASLGELIQSLGPRGIDVPDGFALTADAFRLHLTKAGLVPRIYEELADLNVRDVAALSRVAAGVRRRIAEAPLPPEVETELAHAYAELSRQYGVSETDVAVRSSATAEDLPSASFAGQQETYLNVLGLAELVAAVRRCMASLFTDRAIVYRSERGFAHDQVALSVGVQKMVRSDSAAAGVIFTLDTETGFRDVVIVTSSWGLGESVVQGRVSPDEYRVHKPTLAQGFAPILRRERGDKDVELVYAAGGSGRVEERRVNGARRSQLTLRDEEVLKLARWAVDIEQHYSERHRQPTPMDIEWAKDGPSGKLFIVQARPETVHAQSGPPQFETYRLRGKSTLLTSGKSVGAKVATGRVRVIHALSELSTFETGEVLVAEMTDPDWEPVLARAAAVVTEHGGRTCHAAIVSRELGIPCVVGTGNATSALQTGQEVTVSCAEGDEGHVYAGRVPFDREVIDPASLSTPALPIMLNVGNPETAFLLAQLPVAGVGLLRMEFVVSSWIGVHPLALLQPERVSDERVRAALKKRIADYPGGPEYFVERLASGVALIAAAFYPRPVILRMSDFKTNEYAGLLGGADFEPVEHNPMLGFRGASRYYDARYRAGFALECEAVRRVRDQMGLRNLKLMIPFCRTLAEAEHVLAELEKNGLKRGQNQLEVYCMAEIPNNIVLASEFSELFDGFSIGSNDLTQLVLGIDRDSAELAHLFDEQDPGVKRMIELLIEKAHAKGRKVGICGQAPSDHPEFAEFLARAGIDSISVTSDALPKVAAALRSHDGLVQGSRR